MGTLELMFSVDINTSAQIGDTVYYASISSVEQSNINSVDPGVVELGTIKDIRSGFDPLMNLAVEIIEVNFDIDITSTPPDNSYIFFSKDNRVNLTSILGYYGEAKFKNNSRQKAELFASACGIVESSKQSTKNVTI